MKEAGFFMLISMKKDTRFEAIRLRSEGWAYSVISRRLCVSKSTLSCWLRMVPFRPNEEEVKRITKARAISAQLRGERRLESIRNAHTQALHDIGAFTKRDLFMFGLGLYLGEGSKAQEQVQLVNADPDTIRIGVEWLKHFCLVPDENLRLIVHGYPDTDVAISERFWSDVSGIPLAQFSKAIIDRRTSKISQNAGKLPYGTAHVRVVALGRTSCGVLLHRRIMGWLETVKQIVRA